MPEFLLGVSLLVALIFCVTLYGQRENLASENSELLFQLEVLRANANTAPAESRSSTPAGDVDLGRLVGNSNSDSSEEG